LIPDAPGNIAVVMFPDNAFKYMSSFRKHLPNLFPQQVEAATAPADPFASHLRDALAFAKDGPDIIDVAEAKRLIANKVPLIDVRNPDEYATARIGEAINLPLGDLSKGLTDGLPADRSAPVMTICARGLRSVYGMLSKRRAIKT
jgi:hypothetical protein